MYSLEEKERVIKQIGTDTNIDELVFTTGISRTTILNWKKEKELREYILRLINMGYFEEENKK